jgi:hypothetical protein
VTPQEIEKVLADIATRIEHGQVVVHQADERFTEAQRDHEWSMAHALLRAEGSNAEARKAVAVLACKQERIEMDVAGLALRDAQGRMRALRDKADLYRSIGSSVRTSMSLS